MDLARLQKLKTMIASEKEIAKVFHYFFDHFGESEAFLNTGKPTKDRMLIELATAAGGMLLTQLPGPHLGRSGPGLLIQVPRTTFIHGQWTLGGRPGLVLYFTDIRVGVLSMIGPGKNPMSYFARFGAEMLPPGTVPSGN